MEGDITAKFPAAVLFQPRVKRLLSSEHLSVDGTLIEVWASMKSFKPKGSKGGDGEGDGGRNTLTDSPGPKALSRYHFVTSRGARRRR
jgi:hypothetical protein